MIDQHMGDILFVSQQDCMHAFLRDSGFWVVDWLEVWSVNGPKVDRCRAMSKI